MKMVEVDKGEKKAGILRDVSIFIFKKTLMHCIFTSITNAT